MKLTNMPYSAKIYTTSYKHPDTEEKFKKATILTGHIRDVMSFFKDRPVVKNLNKPNHFRTIEYYLYDDSDHRRDFCGGLFQTIFEPISISDFRQDFKKFETSATFNQQSRRRQRSEYDGDWDYDRRYDITPFSKREFVFVSRKKITINVNVGASGSVSSEVLNKYAVFVSNFIDSLEKSGVAVELNTMKEAVGFLSTSESSYFNCITKVKASDEYLTKSDIFRALSSNYFRRIGFAEITLGADLLNTEVSYSLGSPLTRNGKAFTYNTDKGILNIHSSPTINDQHTIVELLQKELFNK